MSVLHQNNTLPLIFWERLDICSAMIFSNWNIKRLVFSIFLWVILVVFIVFKIPYLLVKSCSILLIAWVSIPQVLSSIEDLYLYKTIKVQMFMVVVALSTILVDSVLEGCGLLILFEIACFIETLSISMAMYNFPSSVLNIHNATVKTLGKNYVIYKSFLDLEIGDIIFIDPTHTVPVNCIYIGKEGTFISNKYISGESQQVLVSTGEHINAGAINEGSCILKLKVTSTESILLQLYRAVQDVKKANESTKFGHHINIYLICITLSVAIYGLYLFFYGNMLLHPNGLLYKLACALTVLSPCALVISTPIAYISCFGVAFLLGCLCFNMHKLQNLHQHNHFVFDKTGTLTDDAKLLWDGVLLGTHTDADNIKILSMLAMQYSTHFICATIIPTFTKDEQKLHLKTTLLSVHEDIGQGISVEYKYKNHEYNFKVGSLDYILKNLPQQDRKKLQKNINILVYDEKIPTTTSKVFCLNINTNTVYGFFVEFSISAQVCSIIRNLQQSGKQVSILSGDNEKLTAIVAKSLNIHSYHGKTSPEDKLNFVLSNNADGIVMIGDGINDTLAMAKADIGIGVTNNQPLSGLINFVADITIPNGISKLPVIILLSKHLDTTIKINVFTSIASIIIGVIATTMHAPLWLCVIIHEGSTILICLVTILRAIIFANFVNTTTNPTTQKTKGKYVC